MACGITEKICAILDDAVALLRRSRILVAMSRMRDTRPRAKAVALDFLAETPYARAAAT